LGTPVLRVYNDVFVVCKETCTEVCRENERNLREYGLDNAIKVDLATSNRVCFNGLLFFKNSFAGLGTLNAIESENRIILFNQQKST